MRDLVRKLDKFVKEKEKAASAKKTQGLAPHLTYGILSASTKDGSNTINNKKKNLSRNFSMTVSFFNPRFDNAFPKDYSIRHEDLKQKNVENASPERYKSPKRDPILQNNTEPTQEFRSTLKLLPQSGKMTIFTEEPTFVTKSRGEFNHVDQARSLSPKIEGKRTFASPERNNSPENQRRLRKACKSPQRNLLNPIIEGDPNGVKIVKQRKLHQEPSEATKLLNERKSALPSELGYSVKGKVFRDTKLTIGVVPIEDDDSKKLIIKRFSSPQHKRGDGMRGLLEYSYSSAFRDEGVSPKCNSIKMSDIIKAGQN